MAREIKPTPPEVPPSRPGGLGEQVERTIQRGFVALLNNARYLLVEIISGGLELLLDILKPVLLRAYRPMLERIRGQEGIPPEFAHIIDETLKAEGEAGAALLLSMGTAITGSVTGTFMQAFTSPLTFFLNRVFQPARADPATAMAVTFRQAWLHERMEDHLLDQGWRPEIIDAFRDVLHRRVTEGDLLAYMLRGRMAKSTVDQELQERGWLPDDIAIIHELVQLIPGPADLITMAVREAFTPDVIDRFNLGAEFPSEFSEWMQKQGYSEQWARRYWYSHWTLPPLGLGYQMLHRGVIDDTELDLLLRTQDVSPYWRGRLKEISYRPLTRVDVRRMYGLGVLDAEGVKKAYLDLGYNEVNAQRMTDFTILYETDTDRQATKTDILSGFREGMLTEREAVDWLTDIGFAGATASYLVAKEQAKQARDRLDAQIAIIEDLYTGRDITEAEARVRLTTLGLSASEIDTHLDDWRTERESQVKRPTQAQYDRFLLADIVTEDQYTTGLAALGFQSQYVDWYLDSVLDRKAEDARREEEKARTEQEDIRKRQAKTGYQADKARLDVDLAELRTAIAEQQVAIRARRSRFAQELGIIERALTVTELEEEAQTEIDQANVDIASHREVIALLREQVEQTQTLIADSRLAEAEYRETLRFRVQLLEDTEAIRQAFIAGDITGDQARAQLTDLGIAEGVREQLLADWRERPEADPLAELAEEAEERGLAFDRERRELQVQLERTQDTIAESNTAIQTLQTDIASIRVRLRQQIDLVRTLQTETELRLDFEADLASMQTTLDQLRVNLARLKEDKARLAAGFRQGLVQ